MHCHEVTFSPLIAILQLMNKSLNKFCSFKSFSLNIHVVMLLLNCSFDTFSPNTFFFLKCYFSYMLSQLALF